MISYNTKDIALQRKKTHGFEEYRLTMQPNSVIVSDAANNLSMVDTQSFYSNSPIQPSASYSQTASFSISANSASYAPTIIVGLTATRSFVDSASLNTHVVFIKNGLILDWQITAL